MHIWHRPHLRVVAIVLVALVSTLLSALVCVSLHRDHVRREMYAICADGCGLSLPSLSRILGDPDLIVRSGQPVVATRACESVSGNCTHTVAFRGSWLSPLTTWTFDIGADGMVVNAYEHNMP